jgi:hypothetical protein
MILERELDTCWIFFHFISNFYIIFKIQTNWIEDSKKRRCSFQRRFIGCESIQKNYWWISQIDIVPTLQILDFL